MKVRIAELQASGKILEAQRLMTRTRYDMQMLSEVGYCSGIENYSAILTVEIQASHRGPF